MFAGCSVTGAPPCVDDDDDADDDEVPNDDHDVELPNAAVDADEDELPNDEEDVENVDVAFGSGGGCGKDKSFPSGVSEERFPGEIHISAPWVPPESETLKSVIIGELLAYFHILM